MNVQQKSEWLIEWENSGSTLSFANWMIGKTEALEAKLSKMEEALRVLADPMSYEHIGKFHGRKSPWAIAKEALAGGDSE